MLYLCSCESSQFSAQLVFMCVVKCVQDTSFNTNGVLLAELVTN